ncbi:MAG: zinc-binding dehydrogenase [Burkholderiales bacterium]|nr:zinc-binding dehydrogenase [Burkholderiales bacterium]
MQAQVLRAAGGVGNFELTAMPVPNIQAGKVLLQMAATSINPIDIKIREGLPVGPQLPGVIGCDVAGTVRAVGADVHDLKVGDEVYGAAAGVRGLGGAMAEYVSADARLLAPKPVAMSVQDSAALALIGITASEGIRRCQVGAGDQVLIQGGNGGVGHIAIQLATARGAKVTAAVRSEKSAQLVLDMGAHDVIVDRGPEHRQQEIKRITGGKGFDVVFDTVGGASLDAAFQAAALNGRVAAISARSTHDLSLLHGKGLTLNVVFMLIPLLYDIGRERHGLTLRELATLVDNGKLRVRVDPTRFDLVHAAAAHEYFSSGRAQGKVVIRIR